MKRVVLLALAGALAAGVIFYGLRLAERTAAAEVTALLPRETIALAHLPDFNRLREQWHQTDFYQIYSERSVQDFFRGPSSRPPKADSIGQTLEEIGELGLKDLFVACTSIVDNNPKFVVGFRFSGSQQEVEKLVDKWRSHLVATPGVKREQLDYERGKIDVITSGPLTLTSVHHGHWFFASNDLTELKAILYRADHRTTDQQATLSASETFRAGLAQMPPHYAGFFYLEPKIFAEKIAMLRRVVAGQNLPGSGTPLEKIRSISGTTRFEKGKIHDVTFAEMPRTSPDAKLKRSSLALGTKDTFFYFSLLFNVGEQISAMNQAVRDVTAAPGWQQALQIFATSGVTANDWSAAFELEVSALMEWPATARLPWLFITTPVLDAVKAGKIIEILTASNSENTIWTRTEKEGVRYFSMQTPAAILAIEPTIALSNRFMVVGQDPISVEMVLKRIETTKSELADTAVYGNAEGLVPAPTTLFAYLDTSLLYSRLDAALRPLILMSAPFIPWLKEEIDPEKIPPPETVTRHLSPIVLSQKYADNGYITESVGPFTFGPSGIGLASFAAAVTRGAQWRPAGLNSKVFGVPKSPGPATQSTPVAPKKSETP